MELRDWRRYQRDVDELLASYAFATAASGLVLLAGRYEPAAAAAGGLYFLVQSMRAVRAARLGALEQRLSEPHPLLQSP